MRYTTPLLTAAALLTLAACTSTKPTATMAPPSAQTVKQFKFKKTETAQLNYLLFLPKGYEPKADKRWPLMLFLHGAGERGTNIWKVATHGPPKNVATNPDFPFILVSPQCPEHQVWSKDVLLGLLDDIIAHYAVATNRVYLTGLSMGGYGTWDLGLTYPEKFAAIVPICGGGELITLMLVGREKEPALKNLGVWAFHGGLDLVVPLTESQRMVNALKMVGMKDVKLTVIPNAGHDSWTAAYNNPELYEWLLSHQRGK
jgi:predicted peptidase